MIVRAEQIQTLEAYANDAFAKEMAEHLRSFAPRLCEVVGEATVSRVCRLRHPRALPIPKHGGSTTRRSKRMRKRQGVIAFRKSSGNSTRS